MILSMFGVGNLIGMPLAGSIIDYAPLMGLPPYRTMFLTMASLMALATAIYVLYPKKTVKDRLVKATEPGKETLADPPDMADAIV